MDLIFLPPVQIPGCSPAVLINYFAGMPNRIHYDQCPVCHSREIHPLFTAKDHTVSKEDFVIWQCSQCTLRFTQDVPDQASIGRYYKSEDYISHTNTTKGTVNKIYQRVRKRTLQQKADLVIQETGVEQGKLLDFGAGTGAFLHLMQTKGWDTTGIEPDPDARTVAMEMYNQDLQEPGTLYALPSDSYHAITLWHVLEHVHDLHLCLEQLKNLLTRTGKLIIAVPNYESLDASIYKSFWAAYDVPRHLYHFTPRSIEVLVNQHRLKLVSKKPMWFDSFYISLLSSKYRLGKTRYISAFISGLRSNITAMSNKDRSSSLVYIIEKQ